MASTILNDNTVELQQEITEVLLPANAKTTTGDLRKAYADGMNKAPFNDKKRMREIMDTGLDKPIFQDYAFEGDALPDRKELLRAAMDATIEVATLDNGIVNAADSYARLIANTIGRLNVIKERLKRNQERKADIDFARNAYSGLKNVLPITEEDVSGGYGYYNNTFMASPKTIKQVRFTVDGVTGNGYSGNSYVLDKDGSFVESYDDRSLLTNISDDSVLTVYEYSRLCSVKGKSYYTDSMEPETGAGAPASVNYDDKDAVCVLTLHTKEIAVGMLALDTTNTELKIENVETSDDGVKYASAITNVVNLAEDIYHAEGHIPGSNIVCFPETRYIRLTLSSGHVDEAETLAYEKTAIVDGKAVASTVRMENVVRKAVSLGGIRLYSCTFANSSMHTGNLCPENGCKRIAVFCNTYTPAREKFSDQKQKPLELSLYVNGKTYPVVPINSNEDGVKLLTCAESGYGDKNVKFIDEPIRTAQLQVDFHPQNTLSPFIGNLKVCIG